MDALADYVNTYDNYLRSVGWRMTKRIRKKKTCEHCNRRKRLELHHWRYDWHNANRLTRFIFPNLFDPMSTLCNSCHRKVHKYD